MCLITFSFRPDQPRYLLLAANRDELHARPTRSMAWWRWPEGPLAGRDEQAGGSWLAVGRDGRWAAVTNFRDPDASAGSRSRGELPVRFIESGAEPEAYARKIHARREDYGPFNLLAGNGQSLWYASSHGPVEAVQPGVHALSNGLLDADWPKSRRVTTAVRGLETAASIDAERLFELMDDRQAASDSELPDTGVGPELERFLSPPFIIGERYGTRCTSVLALGRQAFAAERSYDSVGSVAGELRYEFTNRLEP